MARHSRGVRDSLRRLDDDRLVTEAGAPVRLRFLTRAQLGLVALLLLAPLLPSSASRPAPAWEISTGRSALIEAVTITADGRRVAAAGEGGGVVLCEEGRDFKTEIPGLSSCKVTSVAFSPDDAILAVACRDGEVALWDVVGGQMRASLKAHAGPVLCLAFSPDGSRLATASADKSIRLWDVATATVTSVLRGHELPVYGVRFAPDGRMLASTSSDGLVRLWDVAGREARERHQLPADRSSVQAMAFSPDGSTFATGGFTHGVKLWDVATGRERSTFSTDPACIRTIAFSADGRILITLSYLGTVQRWEVATGLGRVLLRDSGGASSAEFSSDTRRLVIGGIDSLVRIWDLTPWVGSEVP